ncbi:50S ribosomal protein L18 [Patescibacteria group bacterium]
MTKINKQLRTKLRTRRTKSKIVSKDARPRLVVYRSNKGISVQVIDDKIGKTIVTATSREISRQKQSPVKVATAVGELIAKKAIAAKVKKVVFDRRGYAYHGRVKEVAEAARKNGLIF